MQKQWQTPELNVLGSVETVTQTDLGKLVQVGGFTLPSEGFGLLASLEI